MNLLCVVALLCVGAIAQPTSDSLIAALDAKVAEVNITDFYIVLGNEGGLFYSYQKGTKVANTTRFNVASASKWVSSVLFNTLIYNGTLSLLDSPQDYIEWWTKDSTDKRARTRIQHLLNFQSGFAPDADCVWDQNANLEDCIKSVYENNSLFEPGKTFFYTENHMQIMALIVQKKTGKTFLQLFEEYIKRPLGLTVSTYNGDNPRPASSLSSNVVEYEKILRSIYLKTILPPDVIDMMEQDQTNVTVSVSPASEYGVSWHYALGQWVECPYEKWNSSCLTEINRRSSPGGLGFYPWIDRKMNYYGILSTFQTKGFFSAQAVDGFRDEIHALLASVSPAPVSKPAGSPASPTGMQPSTVNTPSSNATAGSSQVSTVVWFSFVSYFLSLLIS